MSCNRALTWYIILIHNITFSILIIEMKENSMTSPKGPVICEVECLFYVKELFYSYFSFSFVAKNLLMVKGCEPTEKMFTGELFKFFLKEFFFAWQSTRLGWMIEGSTLSLKGRIRNWIWIFKIEVLLVDVGWFKVENFIYSSSHSAILSNLIIDHCLKFFIRIFTCLFFVIWWVQNKCFQAMKRQQK